MDCEHEKYTPEGSDDPDWSLMNWDSEPNLKVNMCKKCGLVYVKGFKE